MPKFIVELWLDGYETEKEMEDACEEFIYDQLNFTASCVKIERIKDPDHEAENSMCACPTCINEGWAAQEVDDDRQR